MKSLLKPLFAPPPVDAGLLVLRVGIGGMFAFAHGWGKLTGGAGVWERVGRMGMEPLGLGAMPDAFMVAMGLMAAVAEFFGGLAVAAGILTRPAAAALVGTMVVAASTKLVPHGLTALTDPKIAGAWPVEMGIVVLAIAILGAGRFSLDALLQKKIA